MVSVGSFIAGIASLAVLLLEPHKEKGIGFVEAQEYVLKHLGMDLSKI